MMHTVLCSSSNLCFHARENAGIFQPKRLIHVRKFSAKHGASRIMCSSENTNPSNGPQSKTSGWKIWATGIVLCVAIPSSVALAHKFGYLLALKNKINKALKTVETTTEAIQEVAAETEKIIEDIESKIQNDPMLRKSLSSMEALAHEAETEAKKAENLIHQVGDIEKAIGTSLLKSATSQKKTE